MKRQPKSTRHANPRRKQKAGGSAKRKERGYAVVPVEDEITVDGSHYDYGCRNRSCPFYKGVDAIKARLTIYDICDPCLAQHTLTIKQANKVLGAWMESSLAQGQFAPLPREIGKRLEALETKNPLPTRAGKG